MSKTNALKNEELNKITQLVLKWCHELGDYQVEKFRNLNDDEIHSKSNKSDLVTNIDKSSEEFLRDKIQTYFPNHQFIGEESSFQNDKKQDLNHGILWIVDPIDGTNNFVQGLPIWCISVGLRVDGETQLAVVHVPYIRETYRACKGQGAYLNDVPIQCAQKSKLAECVLATGFPYDKNLHPINNLNYLNQLLPKIRGIRRMGSAAYDLCSVGAGHLDGYWEINLNHWDVEAGQLIVQEAGGVIKTIRKDRNVSILAANKKLAKIIEKELQISLPD